MDPQPVDLDTIKDDLGISLGDTHQDERLQRRIDGVSARMEAYRPHRLAMRERDGPSLPPR
jgi:hypothetical protein